MLGIRIKQRIIAAHKNPNPLKQKHKNTCKKKTGIISLAVTYPTTSLKADGQIVLVKFADEMEIEVYFQNNYIISQINF